MAVTTVERDQYCADGGIRVGRSAVLILLPILSAMVAGFLLHLLFQHGWYLVVLAACAAGGIVAGGIYVAVRWTHCRKPWLAFGIGAAGAVLCYLAFFYFGMRAAFGPAAGIETLPTYIQFRMATDVQEDVGRNQAAQRKPSPVMNWLLFGTELLMMVLMASEAARKAAGRVYDTDFDCWTKSETVRLVPGAYDSLEQALQNEALDEFLEVYRPAGTANQNAMCQVTLEYTIHPDVSPLERPVYLSAVEAPLRTAFRSLFARSSLLLQKELTAQEAIRFQRLFSGFARAVAARHSELAEINTQQMPLAGVQKTGPAQNRQVTQTADIEPIPEQERMYLYSGKHLLMENLCGGLPILLLAAAAGFGWLAAQVWDPASPLPGIAAVAAAILMAVPGLYLPLMCPHTAETAYARSVVRRSVAHRPERIVDPDEPDAFPVALTVREKWQKTVLETATDGGLAVLDHSARVLKMECDVERFIIPLDSIVSCAVEPFSMPIDPNTEFWYVRLIVQTRTASRELLICPTMISWIRNTNTTRRQRAEQFAARLTGS
ncbi:MAG: hypothetical protein R3C49_12205 [Planctomycetaceae bacterium]